MKLGRAVSVAAMLITTGAVVACGSNQDEGGTSTTTSKQGAMDEQQAMKRAEQIIRQAVDGMSPKRLSNGSVLYLLEPALRTTTALAGVNRSASHTSSPAYRALRPRTWCGKRGTPG